MSPSVHHPRQRGRAQAPARYAASPASLAGGERASSSLGLPFFGAGTSQDGSSSSASASAASESSAADAADTTSANNLAAALITQYAALPGISKAQSQDSGNKKYLSFERRSLWSQCSYNAGYTYFTGLAIGGAVGLVHGVRNTPNYLPRIVLNSVLNSCGKFGARAGNAGGVLALLYTVLERQLEDVEVDRLPSRVNNALGVDVLPRVRSDAFIPLCTAFATGMLFTVPRAVTMRGIDRLYITPVKRVSVVVTGGVACTVGVLALSVLGPLVFGERSPFRFA